ncbi:MAG: haloacid dehalogenase type II [Pseudomonadota bacterium]
MPVKLVVFDAYGTLFDVSAAAREAAEEDGFEILRELGPQLAETWRQKQLGYSWLRASYGAHTDFWSVTQDALDFALEAHGLDGDQALRDRLLQLYWELRPFDEVPRMLNALQGAKMPAAILSNGSPEMLDGAVEHANLQQHFVAILSADQVGVFKPNRAVYDLVGACFGIARHEVLFVSSNGWDAAFATGYGFRTVWVNRRGEPVDRLPFKPEFMAENLSQIPHTAQEL